MASFSTTQEMFEEYLEQREQAFFSLSRIMTNYADRARSKLGEHAECIAEAYIHSLRKADQIFGEEGLDMIHAFAVLDDIDAFEMEYKKS
jgi:hypothetical protein